ncbi:MAG TPA: hypothetical protein VM364_03505 [Vicinamibacterales bacterium]|nr:hypothetical protein [Vicinamibacterales bacterium]
MERRTPTDASVRQRGLAVRRAQLIRELQELIAALDARVPHVERAGEADIARDADALRRRAVARLAELEATAAAAVRSS